MILPSAQRAEVLHGRASFQRHLICKAADVHRAGELKPGASFLAFSSPRLQIEHVPLPGPFETATTSPLPDAIRERYVLERELGRGGMATVYLARDLKHGRLLVALKVLRPELANALGPERFLREIEIAASLSHPNILPLYDSGTVELQPGSPGLYYAITYVDGESLRSRLDRERQLPVEDVLRIARELASALAYAHERGVVHRDLKPENVLLSGSPPRPGKTGEWQVLLMDFGIAKAVNAAGVERLTETGLALGTPAYMSPEQASGEPHLDCRSDLYALGCMLYELLAGQPPFTGPTAQSIAARHAVDPVPSLRTVRPTVPESIERAIERALAKVPADRFNTVVEFADALTPKTTPESPRRRSLLSRRRVLLGATACTVAVMTVAGAIRWRAPARPAVVPSAARIAVLPLVASTGDTALSRLGRDLAITVSASLDGVGGIQMADRLSIARETTERPANSPSDAAGLAHRLGARSVLFGTVVGGGANVRLDLGLYDAEGGAPLAQGITVVASRDSLSALTDSVVWALLRQVWRQGDAPTPSLAAVTTRSVSALRAFLEGERDIEQNRWDDAVLAYRSAIAADSTFWLAYFRYSLAQSWQLQEVELIFSDAVYRHRNVFPERDRLLVEAWAAGDTLPLALDRYSKLTERFPDYWPGWFLLGDALYHVGPLLGHDWRDAQRALNHAVALNPNLKPAWMHLFQNSVGKDTIESGLALARLRELPPDFSGRPARDPAYYIGARLFDAVAHSGGITPETSALADSGARLYLHSAQAGISTFLLVGFPAAQVEFNRRVLRLEPGAAAAAYRLTQNAYAWAERGAWDSALASLHEAVRVAPPSEDPVSAVQEYELAVLGVFLGALDPEAAVRRGMTARMIATTAHDPESKTELLGQLAWFDGVLAFARRDRTALDRARQDVRRSGHPQADVLDRSLLAFGQAMAGDRAAAGRALAALEWHCVSRWAVCGGFYPHSPNVAIHRVAAATWLLESGDTAQAARLLTWHERGVINEWEWSLTYPATPLAYLMLARIEEAQGDSRSASEHYKRFLRCYDSPMPGQRHLVQEARAALARVSGTSDTTESR